MSRPTALVLLAVFGVGVFLAGLELMITAVALPSIVTDLADWTELRTASWIINGYLLVYVVAMPLAGRIADLWGTKRLFLVALVVFILGSAAAGRAQSLEELIAARLLQGAGGGALVPVGTAAASHLFGGDARPRALGLIGALTFLGMAAGPFIGAAILSGLRIDDGLARLGLAREPIATWLAPAWRWVFYVNVPIGIVALALGWAAAHGWDTPRRRARIDVAGAALFTLALAAALVGLTLAGADDRSVAAIPGDPGGPIDAAAATPVLLVAAAVAGAGAVLVAVRREDPFLDPRLFRRRVFSSAALVSLLTGYGLATAIIGGAVFVDRVLYGGPDQQRIALGALAGATAVGALASGFLLRVVSLRLITLVGLSASTVALVAMASWTPDVELRETARWLALFGIGFGLTVTPRSTAAVESLGRSMFGIASATVTVARMVGMAVGLAVLTAYGSTTIDRLYDQVYATPDAYKAYIPTELRDRPLRDGLVVQALEDWAAGEAARIMVGVFLVAAALTAAAVPAALAMGERRSEGHPSSAREGPPADAKPSS